jgi:phosphonopyruvate decarboxylase
MLQCEGFSKICQNYGFTFFSGVPDSTFKSWISYLNEKNEVFTNIVTVNECEATAVCAGYHLATGNIGVLYTQNDGFGKTVNPLTSLCDPEVYRIPILFMIGWRGEPGKPDAVQHRRMGKILLSLLELLEIPYEILPVDLAKVDQIFKKAKEYMQKNSRPYAVIIRKGTFEDYVSQKKNDEKAMSREEALETVMGYLSGDEIIVSTTGKLSRELYEYRVKRNRGFDHDFFNIGAMGCAQGIALGIALQKNNRNVLVFDGDGSVLMQLGSLATTGHYAPRNFYHVIFDNNAHDSTGGQPTSSNTVDFAKVARACNYRFGKVVTTKEELKQGFHELLKTEGPALLVIKVKKGARKELQRPSETPVYYKTMFMKSLMGSA